jgi:hypothetical protein
MQGQWLQAVEMLRPLADRGDEPLANALVALWLGNAGQASDGVRYARQAVEDRVMVAPIAGQYVGWVLNDPLLRKDTPYFYAAAIDAGWNADPLGHAQQLFQFGAPELAIELLASPSPPSAGRARESWTQVVADIEGARRRVDGLLSEVDAGRGAALNKMETDQAAVQAERQRVADLVGETTALVQDVAADTLAKEYAERAAAARGRATWWTAATLIVSTGAIALAAWFVLAGLSGDHDPATVLSKAAITLPLLALAAYLNRMGSEERRDARSWTHVELQIRTARPYLGNLGDSLRDEVQAALALRFFPGQSQDPHGGPAAEADDALALVRELRGAASTARDRDAAPRQQ